MVSKNNFQTKYGTIITIAGHGHLLVLVSCIYDPAFYYTHEELQTRGITLDVESVVEEPEIHILGRSKSSLRDQCMFSECRVDCLLEMSPISISEDVLVADIMHFFRVHVSKDNEIKQIQSAVKTHCEHQTTKTQLY